MQSVIELHEAVKRGDLPAIQALLAANPRLANARSETDPRGTYLSWAAFFGRPESKRGMGAHVASGSDPGQRNKHGLTPLACALGGAEGQWKRFSNASLEDWRRCVQLLSDSSSP